MQEFGVREDEIWKRGQVVRFLETVGTLAAEQSHANSESAVMLVLHLTPFRCVQHSRFIQGEGGTK